MKNKNLSLICAYDAPTSATPSRNQRGLRAITDSCSVQDFLGRGRSGASPATHPLYKMACRMFGMSRAQRRTEIGRLTDSQRRQLLAIRQRIVDSAVDYPANIAWAIENIMSGGREGYSELYTPTRDGVMPLKQYPEIGKWLQAVDRFGYQSPEAQKAARKLGKYTVIGRVHDDDALDAYLERGQQQEHDLTNAIEGAAAEAATLSEEAQQQLNETKTALQEQAQSFVAGLVDTVSAILPSIVSEQATSRAAEEATDVVEQADETLDEDADKAVDEELEDAELSDRFGLEYREDEKMGDSVSVTVNDRGGVVVDTPTASIASDGREVRANIFGFDAVDPAAEAVIDPQPEDVTIDETVEAFDDAPEGDDDDNEEDYTEEISEEVMDSMRSRLSAAGRAVLDAMEDEAPEALDAAVDAFRAWLEEEWDTLVNHDAGASEAIANLADELREPLQQLGVTATATENTLEVDGDVVVEVSDAGVKVGSMSYEFDLNERLTRTLVRNVGDEFRIVIKGAAGLDKVSDAEDDGLLSEKAKDEVLKRVNEAVKKRLEEKGIEIADSFPKDTIGSFEQLITKGWGAQLLMAINGYLAHDFRRYAEIRRKLAARYGREIMYIADLDTLETQQQLEALRYLASKVLTEEERVAILEDMFDEDGQLPVADGIMDVIKGAVKAGKKIVNHARLKVGDRIQAGDAIVTVVKKNATTFLGKLPKGKFQEFKYPKKLIEIPKDAIDPQDYPEGAPDFMVSDAANDEAANFVEVIERIYGTEDDDKKKAVEDIFRALGNDVRKEFEADYRRLHDEEVAEANAEDVLTEYVAWADAEELEDLAAFFKSLHEENIADAAGEGHEDAWAKLAERQPLEQMSLVLDTFTPEELEGYLVEAAKRMGFNSVLEMAETIADKDDVALRLVADFKENAPQDKYEAVELKMQETVGDAMDPNEDGDERITINWTKEKLDQFIAERRKKDAKKRVEDEGTEGDVEELEEAPADCAGEASLPAVSPNIHEGAPNNYDMSHTQATYAAVRNTRAALENILAAVTKALALTEPLTVEQYQQGGLEEKILGAVSDSTFAMNELDLFSPILYKRKFTDSAWVADNIDELEGVFGVTIPEQFKGMSALISAKPISDSAAAVYGGQMRLTFPYDGAHTLHVVPFQEE